MSIYAVVLLNLNLVTIIWLIVYDQQVIVASSNIDDFSIDSIIKHERELISNSTGVLKVDNPDLFQDWQDWVLANIVAVHHLNNLMVLASRQNFTFSIPPGYMIKYIQNPTSFHRTVSQLATEMRSALTGAREDLNRVHTGMERVPGNLKKMVLFMKHAPLELLLMLFPDSFEDIKKLVDDSLIVLRNPERNFGQVLNLVTEIDYLLTFQSNDHMTILQVLDLKTQWTHLTMLVKELAKRAERAREGFLFQFNWLLQETLRPDILLSEANRDFIIRILLPKIVEIDQTSDFLAVITKTYTDVSSKFTDAEIGGYGHLLTLTQEDDRKRYLKQFQYELITAIVPSTRLALQRHGEFLERDKTRRANFEKFLTETSMDDLISIMG